MTESVWAVEYRFEMGGDWELWTVMDSKEDATAEAELLGEEFDEPIETRVRREDGEEWGA